MCTALCDLAQCNQPEECTFGSMKDIVSDQDISDKLYITPVACYGILRRGRKINPELKKVLERISSEMTEEEIEKNLEDNQEVLKVEWQN